MATQKKSPRQLDGLRALTEEERSKVAEVEEQVMALRIKGVSFNQINKQLGISSSARVFKRALARQGENTAYVRAEAVRIEAERLDALQSGIWDRATKGQDPKAVEAALKILERRANLFGLDFQHMVNARAVEIEEAKAKMMAVALGRALQEIKTTPEQKKIAMRTFLGELRMLENPSLVADEDQEAREVLGELD